jgi:ABC-type multidrug transport system ATPase subunit
MILQDLGLWPSLTVLEHLTHSPRAEGTSKAAQLAFARSLLDHLGLADFAKRTPGNLSGGEQQRVAIGAVLMGSPKALLLDEPFGSLDLALKLELMDLVDKWASKLGCALILVSHNVSEAERFGAQRLLILENGRKNFDDHWKDLAQDHVKRVCPTLTAWRAHKTNQC